MGPRSALGPHPRAVSLGAGSASRHNHAELADSILTLRLNFVSEVSLYRDLGGALTPPAKEKAPARDRRGLGDRVASGRRQGERSGGSSDGLVDGLAHRMAGDQVARDITEWRL
jgi:hypothetical protein